jgi:hypothetical protein
MKLDSMVLISQFIFKSRDLFLGRCKVGRGASGQRDELLKGDAVHYCSPYPSLRGDPER